MAQALYDFFRNLVNFETYSGYDMSELTFDLFGMPDVQLVDYLSIILTYISLILIIVLCCLFIYRIIRLVGRLFSGGAL